MNSQWTRIWKRLHRPVAIAVLGALLVNCSGDEGGRSPTAPSTDPVSITLNVTSLRLLVGNTRLLEADARTGDGGAATGTIQWSSSAPSVASVDGTGRIEAHGAGQATITASSGPVSAGAVVTVPEPAGRVSAAGGHVETPDGAVGLTVPESALSGAVAISIQPAVADSIPQGTAFLAGTTFEFAPSGLQFSRPATLSLAYDPALLSGTEERRLRLHRLVDGAWVAVDGSAVETGSETVRGEISSFSVYGIGFAPNQAPTVEVTSPEDGGRYDLASAVVLAGRAVDPEEGELRGERLSWSSDVDGPLGTGQELTTSELSLGAHVVTLTATDGDGAQATASIDVAIDDPPPTAAITAPADGAVFKTGAEVTFEGSGSDPVEGALSGDALSWESSQDGAFGTGERVTTPSLSEGTHVIRLTAANTRGGAAADSISLTVTPNLPPVVTITSPENDAGFDEGTPVDFSGSAEDAEDGLLTGSALEWRSDRDGRLGSWSSFRRSDLSRGRHTITLSATDSGGGVGEASVEITVYGVPTVEITEPTDGATLLGGTTVDFVGTATDPEDGPLGGRALEWRSDVDGFLGTGAAVSSTSLSAGPHRITLTATDSDGRRDSAGIGITVLPQAPTLVSPAAGAVLDNGCSNSSNLIQWDFQWSSVPEAHTYHLFVIGPSATFPVANVQLTSTSFHHESTGYIIESNRLGWTWNVRARVRGTWSPWSEPRTFDVEPLNTDCGGS